jgi:hypothetical protein
VRDDEYLHIFDRYYLEALQDGYSVKRAEQIAGDAATAHLYQQGRLFDTPVTPASAGKGLQANG